MGSKNKVQRREMQVVVIPVETVLDLIEMAVARGMRRGAQMVLEDQAPKEPEKPASPFLGDVEGDEAAKEPTSV